MSIQDYLNLTSQNPLIGPNEEGLRGAFPRAFKTYLKKLIA